MNVLVGYWPWWLGALFLGGLSFGHWLLLRRPLGVASAWQRVSHWRESREIDRKESLSLEHDAVEAAMLAAAEAEFGNAAMQATASASAAAADPAAGSSSTLRKRLPVTASAAFLVCLVAGGALAGLVDGSFSLRGDLGVTFTLLFGTGALPWIVLFGGGILVGAGTRMAGGCTSGHGLSGCANLQPGSLVATAVFFGTAVVVSLLLGWVLT